MSVATTFDESYYLSNNADVVLAISQGHFTSGLQHYQLHGGKSELRDPNATFDASYYAAQNSDVLSAVSQGLIANVFAHYQANGEAESRAPSASFAGFNATTYLAANTDVQAAIDANAFTSALDHYIAHGQSEGRSGSGVTPVAGTTFTLTTNIDSGSSFTGTANADTYSASDTTLTAGDSLDGGAGTDTLNVSWALAGNENVSAFTTTNLETITLNIADGDTGNQHTATFNVSQTSGVTRINVDGATAANANDDIVAITNIAAGTTISVQGDNLNVNSTFAAAATSGSSDTVALEFNGATSTAATDGLVDVAAGFESATIATTGAASTIGDLTLNGATSITASGDQNLTIRGGIDNAVVTVDASAMTGGLSIVTGNAAEAASGTIDFTFTGGSGNDTVDVTAMDAADEISFTGGAGNDRVVTVDELDSTGDVFDGGDGTDTIEVQADLSASFNTVAKNFEILGVGGTATLTVANADRFSGNQYSITANDTGADDDGGLVTISVDKISSGATFTLDAATGATRDGNAAENNDGVEINVSLATDDTTASANDTITFNVVDSYEEISDDAEDDFETININFTGTAAGTVDLIDFGAAKTVNLAATGAAFTVTSMVLKAEADVVASSSTQNVTATLNTAAVDSYVGGSANDAITLGVAGNLAQGNTFTGGSGTDSLTATATASQNMGILAMTGFETLNLTSAGDVTADLRNVTDLTTLNLTAGNNTDDFTLNQIGSGITIGLDNDTAAILTTTVQAGVTAQSFSTGAAGAVVLTTLALDAGTTSVTIAADSALTATNLTGGSLSSMTITGDSLVTITEALPAVAKTIDASASTGGITMKSGEGVVDTVTLGTATAADDWIVGDDDAVDVIANFQQGTDDLIFDVSDFTAELGAGALNDSTDAVAGGDAADIHTVTSGDTDLAAAIAATANIIKFTDITGINSFSDLTFSLTMDANTANAASGIVAMFWDADDAVARIGYMVDAGAAADANYANATTTFTEVMNLTGLTTANYTALVNGDFAFQA